MADLSILLISNDRDMLDFWQDHLPEVKITHASIDYLPLAYPAITIVDCTTISTKGCQKILEQYHDNTSYVVVLDEMQVLDYAPLFLNTGALIFGIPLDQNAITQVRQLHASRQVNTPPQDVDTITYKLLASKFAEQSPEPTQLLQVIADAVRDSMHADLVAMARMEENIDGDYRIENLAVSRSHKEIEEQRAEDILRPGGHTEYIVKTNTPLIIRDVDTFELDGVAVNPNTISWGFRSAIGLPLMQGEKTFGVMWLLYRQFHLFTEKEFLHLQLHANHAALAYSYPLQKKLADQWQTAAQTIFAQLDNHDSFETTMQKITDGIHESLDCDVVTLYVYHPQWERFDLPYQKGAEYPDSLREIGTVLTDSIVFDMLEQTEPQVIENVPQNPQFGQTNFAKREQIHSTVVLPLHRGDEAVGVVFINFRKARNFSLDERQAIAVLGGQVATAILNARLDEERQKTVELVNNLLERATHPHYLNTIINLRDFDLMQKSSNTILQTIAQETCVAANANRVTIRLVDGEQEKALAKFPPDKENLDSQSVDVDAVIRKDGHSRLIIETIKPVVIPNINAYKAEKHGGIELNPNVVQRWQARVGLPLTSGTKCIGVMWISYKEPRTFTDSELQAFQDYANMAFFTKTYQTMQERLHRALDILHQAHQQISVDWAVDEILYHTMELASQLVRDSDDNPNYHSHLALVEQDSYIAFYQEHNSQEVYQLLNEILGADPTIELTPQAPTIVVQAALSGETQVVNDASTNPYFMPLFTGKKQGSQISIPIHVGDKTFAVVSVEHSQANTFEWYDRATLEALASYVGQLINNNQQQQTLADLIEKQQTHNESLMVLANAAMEQVIKSHDFGNFRAIYEGNMSHVLRYVHDLSDNKDQILSSVNKESYKSLKTAIPDLITRVDRIDHIYQQRIVQSSKSPDLGLRKELPIREWLLGSFNADDLIDLELDDSIDENIVCDIPAYWLREVTKNLISNASRAMEADETLDPSMAKIFVQARYIGTHDIIQMSFSNYGQPVPEAISQLLIKQVIPRSLSEEYGGGRGIGLFMCGIILNTYDGQIEYQANEDYTTFVITLPAFR